MQTLFNQKRETVLKMSARGGEVPLIRRIAQAPRTLVRKPAGSCEAGVHRRLAASSSFVGRQADETLYRIIIFTIFIFMSSKGGLRTGSSNQVPLRSVDL